MAANIPDGATVKIVDNRMDFTDISSQYWAVDAIDFVTARRLFVGTTEAAFTPEAPMTRAMLMVVLSRFDGVDTSGSETWYEKGMDWAVASGISDGSNPNGNITREQLITMLWRFPLCRRHLVRLHGRRPNQRLRTGGHALGSGERHHQRLWRWTAGSLRAGYPRTSCTDAEEFYRKVTGRPQ